jgi:hypothetical protein
MNDGQLPDSSNQGLTEIQRKLGRAVYPRCLRNRFQWLVAVSKTAGVNRPSQLALALVATLRSDRKMMSGSAIKKTN